MDKMTVCLLSDAFPPIVDGVANAVLNYAYNINREWGEAIVAVPSYPRADDSSYPFQVIRYPSIDVRKYTTGYTAGIPFSPELTSALSRQKIDILHAHAPMMSAVMARSLRKRMGIPTVITYHTKYDIDIANVVKNKALQASGIKSVVANVSSFDEVWVVSEGAGQNIRSLGYQGDYIVMPNGVDIHKGHSDAMAVMREIKDYDIPEGIPIFLFVGRLMWYKGFKITLDALKMLKNHGRDFRMVIVGGGADADDIKQYTKDLGLGDKVIFTGVIADRERIRAWYTRASLFLFPSTFDSNGLVVREAAACDLASVLVKGSCAAEGVTDGHNAFLIDENSRSMAAVLDKLCDDMEHMRQVGINAGNDLYLSWEDAVIKAVERYHIITDLYRIGAYEEHDRFSDNLLATGGDLMTTIGKLGNALNQGKIVTKNIISSFDTSGKKNAGKSKKKQEVHKNSKHMATIERKAAKRAAAKKKGKVARSGIEFVEHTRD